MLNRIAFSLSSMLLLLLITSGCGASAPPKGWVEGAVKLGDKPVTGASVSFYSTSLGDGYMADLDQNGHYQTPQSLVGGQYAVTILQKLPEPGKTPPPKSSIPRKYSFAGSSGLSIEVQGGKNTFDIDLK